MNPIDSDYHNYYGGWGSNGGRGGIYVSPVCFGQGAEARLWRGG